MHEPELDPRLTDWLRGGPPGASGWVLEAVVNHVRRHPRQRTLRARWSDAMRAVALQHPATPVFRLVLVLGAATLALTLAGLLYVGSRALIVGPTPTPTPTTTPTPFVIASDRFTDPLGDAPQGATDIIAVTTALTSDRKIVLGVEAADSWPTGGMLLRVWLVVDNQKPGGTVGFPAACNPWVTDFRIEVGPGSARLSIDDAARYGLLRTHPLEHSVAGPLLTVVVPLAALGDPVTVGIGVDAGAGEDVDISPNDGVSCYPVWLVADPTEAVPSERFPDPAGDAGEGEPDIVEIMTWASADGDLGLGVVLAGEWPAAGSLLRAWFAPDPRATCDPSIAESVLYVDQGYTALWIDDRWHSSPDYRVDGHLLTVVVPRAAFGDPDALGLGVRAGPGDGADAFPDDLTTCQAVSLQPAESTPLATPAP